MLIPDKIIVLKNNSSNKLKVKGSQFLGYAFRVETIEAANEKLANIKKKYYDATHHTYAYKLKTGEEKYSDDGEPNGTAGIRILNSINHFNLIDIILIVVRYFGGTKLGVGPLGKAYGETALELLKSSQLIELNKYEKIKIEYNYEYSSTVYHFLEKYQCKSIDNGFSQVPLITCLIKPTDYLNFSKAITDATSGKVKIETTEELIYLKNITD